MAYSVSPSPPTPSSSSSSVLSLVPVSQPRSSPTPGPEWQPILHSSNQVVLYNPRSHALSVARAPHLPRRPCPYCKQPLPSGFVHSLEVEDDGESVDEIRRTEWDDESDSDVDEEKYTRVSDYFQLLAIANDSSRAGTPTQSRRGSIREVNGNGKGKEKQKGNGKAFTAEALAEGYFKTFFQEEYKLGMGANGSVFLCQHVLDGNPLGHFAVKKIAVGESHSYLLNILREVRLLERLHHPNIITYHHAWLESCQFSTFGPKVPTLHVLMQWAEGGSLDDFIDVRLGRKPQHIHINPLAPFTTEKSPSPTPNEIGTPPPQQEIHSRSARIRAFRAYQRAPASEKAKLRSQLSNTQQWTAVHLLSADEVKSLFKDVVEGLAFLHDKSILHLDLKPGNVLLTWDEGRLIPRAMLSDFGTSRDMVNSNLTRSGNTGTLEYTSPESLPSPETGLLQQIDSKSDMWSLGMILHKLLFFKLPYRYAAEGDAADGPRSGEGEGEGGKLKRLEREVLEYPGFKATLVTQNAFEARRLPRSFLVLLEGLLNRVPLARPSVDRVAGAIREGKFDPLREPPIDASASVLVPVRHTTPPRHTPEREEVDMVAERTQLLGLPSPPIQARPMHSRKEPIWGRIVGVVGGKEDTRDRDRGGGGWKRGMWMRVCKGCLMAAKVLTLPALCPSPSRPSLILSAVLLAAAVADTAVDVRDEKRAAKVSAGLAAFHVAVVWGVGKGLFGGGACVV